jgi:hypothetical protein
MHESHSRTGGPQPRSRRHRVDQLCDEFEGQFKERMAAKSELPRIEDFLDRADPADREHLLRELLRVELELRRAAGLPCNATDYRQRYAQYRQVVESLGDTEAATASGRHSSSVTGQASPETPPAIPPVATDRDDLPEAIGRYQIQKVLGRGGFAMVYLARDNELDRLVALKVPRLDRLGSEAALQVFLDEVRKAAQLDHPAIVRVYDVQRGPGTVFIVQEYVTASLWRLTPGSRD